MNAEKLTLAHQAQISAKLNKLDIKLSEYSFPNLYLFREIHQYELLIGEELFIKGITRDKVPYLMPLFIPTKEKLPLIRDQLRSTEILFPLPEEWLPVFDKQNFSVSSNEEDSDYLFHIEKMALMSGRHLSKKRNLVKQFLSSYSVESKELTEQQRDIAIEILNKWTSELEEADPETDYSACLEALHLVDKLGLNGKIYFVDKEPAAFILGEWISPDCYVVHFEKALKSFKGLYQYLLQDFSHSLSKKEGWINLEQDLGILAIRQAKHSYQPDKMGDKMRLKLLPNP